MGRTNKLNINYVVNGNYRARNIASSGHPGGANVAFADGSAHFLSDNLDVGVLVTLAKMQDGDVVEGF